MNERVNFLKNYYSSSDSVVIRSHSTNILEMKKPLSKLKGKIKNNSKL